MLIDPDWSSVRTVKLLTVNKFKIESLEVSALKGMKLITKCETDSAKKMLFNLFFWMASFLESLPYNSSFCIKKLTILSIVLLIISENCNFIINLMISIYIICHFY